MHVDAKDAEVAGLDSDYCMRVPLLRPWRSLAGAVGSAGAAPADAEPAAAAVAG